MKARCREEIGEFRAKYDQLAQAIEGRAVRHLGNASLSPRDLKAIAGTLAQTQRIRGTALGANNGEPVQSVAEQLAVLFAKPTRRDMVKARARALADPSLSAGDSVSASS